MFSWPIIQIKYSLIIKDMRRKTRLVFSSEQKLMIVMEAQRVEHSVAQ